jgi:hypothetical protein
LHALSIDAGRRPAEAGTLAYAVDCAEVVLERLLLAIEYRARVAAQVTRLLRESERAAQQPAGERHSSG